MFVLWLSGLLVAGNAWHQSSIAWLDAQELGIYGNGFTSSAKPSPYARLPTAAKTVVRAPVWQLSLDSAGMFVGFQSNSTTLLLNYTLVSANLNMYHMPTTGVSGCDLYTWNAKNRQWMWIATFTNVAYPVSTGTLVSDNSLAGAMRPYMLYLPLYNGVTSLAVGYDASNGAQLQAYAPALAEPDPIVWYGTSIAQGGVASRPSMAFTSIISRHIGRMIFNFGFSGNGQMELSVAQFLVQTPNPAAVVIDCIHNMTPQMVTNNTVPLVTYLRSQPGFEDIPIILVEGTSVGSEWLFVDVESNENALNKALQQQYSILENNGVKNLYYVPEHDLFRTYGVTVDGVHPTDLGMQQIADYWRNFFPLIFPPAA